MCKIYSVTRSGQKCPYPCARRGCFCTVSSGDGYYCCQACANMNNVDEFAHVCTNGPPQRQSDLPVHSVREYVKKHANHDPQRTNQNQPREQSDSRAGGGARYADVAAQRERQQHLQQQNLLSQQHHNRVEDAAGEAAQLLQRGQQRASDSRHINNHSNNDSDSTPGPVRDVLQQSQQQQHQQVQRTQPQLQLQNQNQQLQRPLTLPHPNLRRTVCRFFCNNPECNPPLGGTCRFYHPPALPQLMEHFPGATRDIVLGALVQCNYDENRAFEELERVAAALQQQEQQQQQQIEVAERAREPCRNRDCSCQVLADNVYCCAACAGGDPCPPDVLVHDQSDYVAPQQAPPQAGHQRQPSAGGGAAVVNPGDAPHNQLSACRRDASASPDSLRRSSDTQQSQLQQQQPQSAAEQLAALLAPFSSPVDSFPSPSAEHAASGSLRLDPSSPRAAAPFPPHDCPYSMTAPDGTRVYSPYPFRVAGQDYDDPPQLQQQNAPPAAGGGALARDVQEQRHDQPATPTEQEEEEEGFHLSDKRGSAMSPRGDEDWPAADDELASEEAEDDKPDTNRQLQRPEE